MIKNIIVPDYICIIGLCLIVIGVSLVSFYSYNKGSRADGYIKGYDAGVKRVLINVNKKNNL